DAIAIGAHGGDSGRRAGHALRVELDDALAHAVLRVAHRVAGGALAAIALRSVRPADRHALAGGLEGADGARSGFDALEFQAAAALASERVIFARHTDERRLALRAD